MLTSLPLDFPAAVQAAVALGFTHVDVVGLVERPLEQLEALAESGLLVACVSLGRALPTDLAVDALSLADRRAAVELVKQQIADAARLGATCCYIVPGEDGSAAGMDRFTDSCSLLSEYASRRMLHFCVEHTPGRALASVAQTLAWLTETGQENLRLLLDVGHCLISGEDPAKAVLDVGSRLGYVHLDDNDGVSDLHWPLLTGRLREDALRRILVSLAVCRYEGALALELNPGNDEATTGICQSRQLVDRLIQDTEQGGSHGP
jgi:sugar phosphate isomerase/epimerase